MATYDVRGPDGAIYSFKGPDDATPAEVEAAAEAHFGGDQTASPKSPREQLDAIQPGARAQEPKSKLTTFFEGPEGIVETGATLASGALAAPLAGIAGVGAQLGEEAGLLQPGAGQRTVESVRDSLTYAPRHEAGKIGVEAAGKALTLGGLLPAISKGAGDAAFNASGSAWGPLLGAAAFTAGEAIPQVLLSKGLGKGPKMFPEEALKNSNVKSAIADGFVIPPSQAAKPGFISKKLEGVSGKIQTAQKASEVNQVATNKLVKEELGISQDVAITPDLLSKMRADSGVHYEALKTVPIPFKTNSTYKTAIDKIQNDLFSAKKEFPELYKSPAADDLFSALNRKTMSPEGAVEVVKKLRSDAKSNFKAYDDPAKQELAKAQKAGADAIEDMMDSNLSSASYRLATAKYTRQNKLPNIDTKSLVANYRTARKDIAKNYSVDHALNDTTGNVSIVELARQLNKGTPLSGKLKKVGAFGQAFPKASQKIETIGSQPGISPFDFWAALGGMATGGIGGSHFGGAGGVAGGALGAALPLLRPVVREGVLSKMAQSRLPVNEGGVAIPKVFSAGPLSHSREELVMPPQLGIPQM